jgi:polyisoprenoid-binding protein YceI
MKIPACFLIVACAALLASPAFAQNQIFTVNAHAVHGAFHVKSGTIDFDRTAGTISGSILVDAGSGTSGNQSRDQKMTNEVLEASHFAEVSFTPHSFTGSMNPAGDSTLQVTGTFTLHGTPHELTVPMQLHQEGSNLTAKTHFTVPYVKWGLKDPSIFILKVAKEAEIDLRLEGHI